MATIHDVADLAGVSKSTVSRVLNGGSVSGRTRERVLQAIDHLDYRPNAIARGLVKRRTQMIGVVVSDLADGYYTEFLSGIEQLAIEQGYDLMVCSMRWDADKELAQLKRLYERQVDGIIIVSGPDLQGDVSERFQQVIGTDVPVVFIDRSTGDGSDHVVMIDNREAAYAATRHLIRLGHRRIAHIAGPHGTSWAEGRQQGYKDALFEADISYDDGLVVWGDFTKEGGRKAVRYLLDRDKGSFQARPTAIFAANDLTALGVMQYASSNGLRIPDDVALVGFDDIPLLSIADIPLTTVRQPRFQMGYTAANDLMTLIDRPTMSRDHPAQPTQRILPTKLIVRSSCGGRK